MTNTTDPTKPVAWTSQIYLQEVKDPLSDHQYMWGEHLCYGGNIPLYDASLLSEYEKSQRALKAKTLEAEALRRALAGAKVPVAHVDPMEGFDADASEVLSEYERMKARLDQGPHGEDAIDVAETTINFLRHRSEALEAEVKRLREALETIAVPKKAPTHGDPTVLRDIARAALEASRCE